MNNEITPEAQGAAPLDPAADEISITESVCPGCPGCRPEAPGKTTSAPAPGPGAAYWLNKPDESAREAQSKAMSAPGAPAPTDLEVAAREIDECFRLNIIQSYGTRGSLARNALRDALSTPPKGTAKAREPNCRRCKGAVKIWKDWHLCDACGHRYLPGLFEDSIPAAEVTGGTAKAADPGDVKLVWEVVEDLGTREENEAWARIREVIQPQEQKSGAT